MRKISVKVVALGILFGAVFGATETLSADTWPDGSEISSWFSDKRRVSLHELGKQYVLTEQGVPEGDGIVRTREIQTIIDRAARNGGGVIVVPNGLFVTGGLHFRPGVHLYLEKGAILRASDEIADYTLEPTRLRGISLTYFCAVINAIDCDGFTLAGEGVIDGNGMKAWRRFWLRRQWNPNATGLDEHRPRILFVSKSKDVRIEGVTLLNSPVWTSHYYDCQRLKILGITTKTEVSPDGWRGPATDGMDLDGVSEALISGCSVNNNDDGIVFKGGFGAWADDPEKFPNNRPNRNIIIEDCHFGEQGHACVGAGSECYDVRNVIVRRVRVDAGAWNLLRLKIRPDTPQDYRGIFVEDAGGTVGNVLQIDTFPRNHLYYEFGDRKDIPKSFVSGIRFKNIKMTCRKQFYFWEDPEYKGKLEMSEPVFENMELTLSSKVKSTHASRKEPESYEKVAAGFAKPPMASKPWCYWYWVNGNVDRETMTSDLEAMKRVGFGGLLLLDPRGYDKVVAKPAPKMDFASPEWVKSVGFAVRECNRLGLEFTMNLSDCGGSLKGPWLTGEDGPKRLVCGVNAADVPADYSSYHDICTQEVFVAADAEIKSGWRNAGGVTARWERDAQLAEVTVVPRDTPNAKKVTLRFGYCLIPNREHDVDVIDPVAVERHFNRITAPLFAEIGDLVGKTWTHVYSVSWEGAIPTWTATFEDQFKALAGYELRPYLPELAGFVPADGRRVLQDYRRIRNLMFKDDFYGTVRRLAHARGLKLYSESGGPWNRDPSVFREADQLAFLGVNDMPQGEFWPVRPAHHSDFDHNRPAANAAHIYGLKRASTEAFTHMSSHYSVWPERLKDSADRTFADGINHFVWHTFSCSPKEFGKPGIEYFAGTHLNPNVTWFEESEAFVAYLARCQVMLQAGSPVTDIAIYGGKTPYRHWGRYRNVPWDGSRVAIPQGYAYDVLNDETIGKRGDYPVFVDGTTDTITWPKLPLPDFEGDFDDIIHRRLPDGTDIYFVRSADPRQGRVTFRVNDKIPELWDPVRGTRRLAPDAETLPDGRIRLPLAFQENGSVFVVFRPMALAEVKPAPADDWPKRQRAIALPEGRWTCEIGDKTYNRLGDWTKSDDPNIRYFSGKAHYRTTFTLKESQLTDRTLFLGRIHGGLGRVLVNGIDCGVVWCLPYRVVVPKSALKSGENALEVVVVNTWRNRLIGDCFLPEGERKTRSCLKYKDTPNNNFLGNSSFRLLAEGYSRNDALEPCGLYGPVELR